MNKINFFITLILITIFCISNKAHGKSDTKVTKNDNNTPNVIIIYIDDLGYGDIGSYGAKAVKTPNIDSLAATGMRFTDAHSSAATCTPSRYSLLTGEHGFRNNARVLKGDAPLLIKPGKPTLATLFKRAGYQTAVVGKWHLGLGNGDVNWNEDIKPGPLEIGFDYSFLLPATGDRVPTVYVENHKVINLDPADPITVSYVEKVGKRPTGTEQPELLRYGADRQHSDTIINGVSRIGYMAGGESALWVDEDFPDVFTNEALKFIRRNQDKPFFLFHSFHDIHVPRLPHKRFMGKTDMGVRGDVILQVDWMVGEVIKELKKLGIADNTLIIFTSDNGPVLNDGYKDKSVELLGDHKPSGPYRGGKYSAYEAGTRVPMIVHWPKRIKQGVSDALISQMDIYRSMAHLLSVELKDGEARDSSELLPTFLGESDKGRDYLLHEAIVMALRHNNWKYIEPTERKFPWVMNNAGIEGGQNPKPQLYDLLKDVGEQDNLAPTDTQKVKHYQGLIEQIKATGYEGLNQ